VNVSESFKLVVLYATVASSVAVQEAGAPLVPAQVLNIVNLPIELESSSCETATSYSEPDVCSSCFTNFTTDGTRYLEYVLLNFLLFTE
jgi:hypothetical protein